MTRLAVLLVAACSSTPSTNGPVAVPVLPDVPFALLDHGQREDFMRERVVSAMERLFRPHDATRYRDFGCPTCHGDGVARGDYAMPNPALTRLSSANDPRAVEWMAASITPAMSALLGEPIDCTRCHVRELR